MKRDAVSSAVLTIVSGAGLCLLFGFFFHGGRIFIPGRPYILFVVSGITGSIFYGILKVRGPRDAALTMFCLYVVNLVVFRVMRPGQFLKHFICCFPLLAQL